MLAAKIASSARLAAEQEGKCLSHAEGMSTHIAHYRDESPRRSLHEGVQDNIACDPVGALVSIRRNRRKVRKGSTAWHPFLHRSSQQFLCVLAAAAQVPGPALHCSKPQRLNEAHPVQQLD